MKYKLWPPEIQPHQVRERTMKYMLWKDLEPGDILQFTDEYLSCYNEYYKNKDLIINHIYFYDDHITIYYFGHPTHYCIQHDGTFLGRTVFKLVKLKDE